MRGIAFLLLGLVAGPISAPASGQEEALAGIYNYVRISDRLATSGQIDEAEIEALGDAGFEVVVNLAPARRERNLEEGFQVTDAGMAYFQIPVDWENPSLDDLELFFEVMDITGERSVHVHCFANMRVSVFVYLYRTLREGVSEAEAREDLLKVWDPDADPEVAQWPRFIAAARDRFGGESSSPPPRR